MRVTIDQVLVLGLDVPELDCDGSPAFWLGSFSFGGTLPPDSAEPVGDFAAAAD